jgi:hypothetical protein
MTISKPNQKHRIFVHNGNPYMRITPCKRLFNSTTIHQVVTRGDFFAVNLQTGIFTVLPQGADALVQNELF